MISELNGEFLVCVLNGRKFMHENRRWLAALLPLMLFAFSGPLATAAETETSEAGAHLLQAEMALQAADYRKAVTEYLKAAELSDSPEIAGQATKISMAYGFDREALAAAKRWHKLEPDSDQPRVYLAQLSFRVGDLRSAKRHYKHLIDKSKEPPGEKLALLARYLADEDDPVHADKLMRMLAKPYPDSALAHLAVANLALQAGDAEYAVERALRSVELDPSNMNARLMYARALLVSGDVDKAIEYTARIIGDDPDPDPDARMELAVMYMMIERDDDALSQVNQVLLEQSNRTDALRLMAIINFRQGHLDAAWEDFHDLLETGRFRMDALYYLGRIADFREEYDRAARFYAQVQQGSYAVTSQRRASVLLAHELGDAEGGLQLLDDFERASPTDAFDMIVARAVLLASLERHDEALEYYDRAIEFRPDDERAVLSRAELLLQMGRLDEAFDEYAGAVKRWPKSAMSLNAYGYSLADRTDRYREAEKLIRKAIKYDPDSPAIIDSLGWVLFKLGQHEEALVHLERAYAEMPDHEVAAHIVEVLVALGREDEAMQRLVAAEEKTPDSKLLQGVRERLFPE
jgi:tetratricopeptide (TPR) repeat protein